MEVDPYCEACGTSLKVEWKKLLKECAPAELRQRLEAKDLDFLQALGPPPAGARNWIELILYPCAKCGATTLETKEAWLTVNAKKGPVVTSVPIHWGPLITAAEHKPILDVGTVPKA
jgi:hypothetical protein